MIILSEVQRINQIKKIDNLIMKAFGLGHKNYEFLLKWKLQHMKAIQEVKH